MFSDLNDMVCLFVYNRMNNFSAIWRLSILLVTRLQIDFLAVRVLLLATSNAARGLGLYGLTQRTGTHVPQWDLKP
jgi:hypothetical protein